MDTPAKNNSPHAVTRIHKDDLAWLQNRAEKHHRTPPEEIAALRELVGLLEDAADYDVLPHPPDGKPVPVVTLKATSHDKR